MRIWSCLGRAAAVAALASAVAGAGASASAQDAPRPVVRAAATAVVGKPVATDAADIFRRAPCLSPKGIGKTIRALPHVAEKLAARKPVTIIAFGSSSTEGYGSTAPEFTYPNRLAAQLRRTYPGAAITVLNRGRGGEDTPEMLRRLKRAVIDEKPDLVIWQVGTNAILRNLDPDATRAQVEDGIARIQAAGADVVLVDPQYVPAVNRAGERASRMVRLLGQVAEQRHVGIFPRFAVMREWHRKQALSFDRFSIADGLHMNDWGYACFAQLLGDDIIRSVGPVRRVTAPTAVSEYPPL